MSTEIHRVGGGGNPVTIRDHCEAARLKRSDDEQEGDVDGHDSQTPTSVERAERDATRAAALTPEQRRDEEATQDEEDVDADGT
jgi:hypothetical protein